MEWLIGTVRFTRMMIIALCFIMVIGRFIGDWRNGWSDGSAGKTPGREYGKSRVNYWDTRKGLTATNNFECVASISRVRHYCNHLILHLILPIATRSRVS